MSAKLDKLDKPLLTSAAPLLVEEMSEELKHLTHLRRQHLHLLTTPRVSCWTLQGVADQLTGLQFLASRCKVSDARDARQRHGDVTKTVSARPLTRGQQ